MPALESLPEQNILFQNSENIIPFGNEIQGDIRDLRSRLGKYKRIRVKKRKSIKPQVTDLDY